MKKILASMVFVGLALAVVGSAVAQPPEGGPPGRERGPRGDRPDRGPRPGGPPGHPIMAALDADKDGTLSADEIEKASDALKLLDKNDDGKLTREELGPPHGPRGDGPPEGRRGRGDGPPEGRRGPRDAGPPDGPRGDRPRRGPPEGEARGPRVLPPGAHEELDLSDEQIAKIETLEEDVKTKIEAILKPEQLERLRTCFAADLVVPAARVAAAVRTDLPARPVVHRPRAIDLSSVAGGL